MTPEEIAELRQKRYNGTVIHLKKLHSDLMVMRVKPDFPRPAHKPGQYCSLGLGNWEARTEGCQTETLPEADRTKVVRRAYSISCSIIDENANLIDVASTEYIEFYIVLVRENADGRVPALTPRLFHLQQGDRLNIGEKITGMYTLDVVKPTDNVIFFGTGTGEAPHNYMAWDLLKRGHTGKILSASCVRFSRDLGYFDTHKQLMNQFPNYIYLPLTTREATITKKVYIQDVISGGELEEHLGAKLDPLNTHVFLCGNPKMIGVPTRDKDTGIKQYPAPTGVIEILEKRGFQADVSAIKFKGSIHFEEYW